MSCTKDRVNYFVVSWISDILLTFYLCYPTRSGIDTGRSLDDSVDLSEALKNHYNPELAMQKLNEVHNWLSSKETPESGYSDEDLVKMGFAKGYNLTAWTEIPGELDSTMIGKLLVTVFTGGRMGFVTGPGSSFRKEAKQLRDALR